MLYNTKSSKVCEKAEKKLTQQFFLFSHILFILCCLYPPISTMPTKKNKQNICHPYLYNRHTHTHLQLEWDLPSRQWLAVTSILLITAAAGVAVPLALRVSAGAPLEERLEVAAQLLESVPLIDGHNDLPWNIRKFLHNKLNDFQ